MPNPSLPQDQDGQDLFNAISSFFYLIRYRQITPQMQCAERKGSSCSSDLQIQALQCLL